jgi:hypothetical protein
MSWTDVNLIEIKTTLDPLPAENFKFQLLGASTGKFDEEEIQVKAKVADGPFTNTPVYVRYPSPSKQDWSPRVMKRLIKVLGVELLKAEAHDPVAFFNRAAGVSGGAFFRAPIKHRETQTTTGDTVVKAEVDIFKIEAA